MSHQPCTPLTYIHNVKHAPELTHILHPTQCEHAPELTPLTPTQCEHAPALTHTLYPQYHI